MVYSRTWCLVWLCLVFVVYPKFAAAAELRLLAITVNEMATGVVAPVVIEDEEIHLAPESFERLRIRLPDVPALPHEGGRYYPLSAHPDTSYRIDQRTQVLHLEVPPEHMLATVVRGGAGGYLAPTAADYGGFFNYDVLSEHLEFAPDTLGGFFELGAFAGDFVGTSTQVLRDVYGEADYVRLDTTITRDFPDDRLSVRWGDSVSRGGAWGRPVRFGGVQFGTNFATQPGFITFPTIDLSGDAALPSTIDVFVNDSQRFSDELPSGPFSIEDLPMVTGAGEVTVVVTDVLGRETVITQSYYTSPRLLRRDLTDFSFETGFLRENFGLESNDYEDTPFFSGTYRHGYTDWLTGELHGELDAERQAFGVSTFFSVLDFGVVSSSLAGSLEDERSGGLIQLGFERAARDFRFSVFGRLTPGDYTDFGVEDTLRSSDAEARANFGVRLDRFGSLSSGYVFRSFNGSKDEHLVSGTYSVGLPSIGSLSVTGLKTYGPSDETIVSVNLTIPLGPRSSVSGQVQAAKHQKTLKTVQAQVAPPLEGGFGTRMSVSDNDFTRGRIELSHTSRYGRFSAEGSKVDEDEGARLNAVGGVAFADGDLFVSRRIDSSFGVASVDGQPNVRVYSENRVIGRTDSDGRLLIHNLRPYEANRIRIEPRDLPIDADVERVSAVVAPRFRSGVVIDFPIDTTRPALLAIFQKGGTPLPPGSAVAVNGGSERYLVGLDGEVMLRGVAMGARLTAETDQGICAVIVDREVPDEVFPHLGRFTCGAEVQ